MRCLNKLEYWRRLVRLFQDNVDEPYLSQCLPLFRRQFAMIMDPPFGLVPAYSETMRFAADVIEAGAGPYPKPVEIYPVSLTALMESMQLPSGVTLDYAAIGEKLSSKWPSVGLHQKYSDAVRWKTRSVAYDISHRLIPEVTRLIHDSRRGTPLQLIIEAAGFGDCASEPLRRWLMAALAGNLTVMNQLRPNIAARGRFIPLRNAGYDTQHIWYVLFA